MALLFILNAVYRCSLVTFSYAFPLLYSNIYVGLPRNSRDSNYSNLIVVALTFVIAFYNFFIDLTLTEKVMCLFSSLSRHKICCWLILAFCIFADASLVC